MKRLAVELRIEFNNFAFQVTLLLSTYILKHKQRLFDTRNIKLAIVKGDILGDAFGVSAFHRCQVNNLMRGQLIPYNNEEAAMTQNLPGTVSVTIQRRIVDEAVSFKRYHSSEDEDHDRGSKKRKTDTDTDTDETENKTENETETEPIFEEFEPEDFEFISRPKEVNISC